MNSPDFNHCSKDNPFESFSDNTEDYYLNRGLGEIERLTSHEFPFRFHPASDSKEEINSKITQIKIWWEQNKDKYLPSSGDALPDSKK